eukprot:366510-Chlamydomonas_euryale.AAC.22
MDYPTEHGTDVIPLARKVKCDARFERAVQQVFGKVLLCRSSELASAVAHRGAFDCVTVEGVQVGSHGAHVRLTRALLWSALPRFSWLIFVCWSRSMEYGDLCAMLGRCRACKAGYRQNLYP